MGLTRSDGHPPSWAPPRGGCRHGEQREAGHPQASDSFLRQGDPVSVYPFIEAERAEQCHVKPACELLEVSRAASYQWARHIPSKHDLDDRALKPRITEIHQTSRGTYGAPRVHAALRRDGVATSTKRVAPADGRAGPGRATQAPVQADHD